MKKYTLLDFKLDLLSIWDNRILSLKEFQRKQRKNNKAHFRMNAFLKKVEHKLK